jgi:hypothetical protein
MRSDEHKAEAERLIAVARTQEDAKALGRRGDPSDPVAVTVLAGVHAQLAAVPDDVIDAEVVDDEATQLVDEAREWIGSTIAGLSSDLVRRLANALEQRAGHSSGVQINADSFDADPDVVEIPASALRDLTDRVVGAEPGRYASTLDDVLATLRGWQR